MNIIGGAGGGDHHRRRSRLNEEVNAATGENGVRVSECFKRR